MSDWLDMWLDKYTGQFSTNFEIDGLVPETRDSRALTMESFLH